MKTGVSPTVLVLVTLITATSTLIAAGIAGWIAARNTKKSLQNAAETLDKSLAHAAAMAALDRAADKAAQHRASRRQAYVTFMTAAAETYRALGQLHEAGERKSLTPESFKELREMGRQCGARLTDAHGTVQVEGPVHMTESAQSVATLMRRAHRLLGEVYVGLLKEGSEGLKEEQLVEVKSAMKKASAALTSFTEAARQTLEKA